MNRSVPESLLICILVLCLALTPVGVRGETEDSGKAQQLNRSAGCSPYGKRNRYSDLFQRS